MSDEQKSHDWAAIKADYVESNDSLEVVRLRHDAPKTSICRHSSEEGWVLAREEHQRKIADERLKLNVERRAHSAAEIDSMTHAIAWSGINKAQELMSEAKTPGDLNLCMLVLERGYKMARLTAGLGAVEAAANRIEPARENNAANDHEPPPFMPEEAVPFAPSTDGSTHTKVGIDLRPSQPHKEVAIQLQRVLGGDLTALLVRMRDGGRVVERSIYENDHEEASRMIRATLDVLEAKRVPHEIRFGDDSYAHSEKLPRSRLERELSKFKMVG